MGKASNKEMRESIPKKQFFVSSCESKGLLPGAYLPRILSPLSSSPYSCVLLWLYLLAKNLNNMPAPKCTPPPLKLNASGKLVVLF